MKFFSLVLPFLMMYAAHCQVQFVLCPFLKCAYCQDPAVAMNCVDHCKKCITQEEIWYRSPLIDTVPQMSKERANRIFHECCNNIDLPPQCTCLCNYDINYNELRQARKAGCKRKYLREILICASGGQDVSDCCERYGAFGGHMQMCRMFCRPTDNRWSGDAGLNSLYWQCDRFIEGYLYCMYINLPVQ